MAEELRAADRFLLTTHEGPDGDALGSLLAMHHILTQLGKDSVMFLAAKEFPLPVEYRFLPLEEVFHEPPVDVVDRVLVFLDCGNIDRMPVDFLHRGEAKILNIDHHHDNTALRHPEPGRHGRLVHRRDPVRAGEAARRGADPGDRGGALRGAGHRHRPVHVREHEPRPRTAWPRS